MAPWEAALLHGMRGRAHNSVAMACTPGAPQPGRVTHEAAVLPGVGSRAQQRGSQFRMSGGAAP